MAGWGAGLLLAGLLGEGLAAPIPVDLRPAPKPPPPPVSEPTPEPPSPRPLLALRTVAEELGDEAAALREETRSLRSDADRLWDLWRLNFGIVGGPFWSGPFSSDPMGAERGRLLRLQSEVFRGKSRVGQLERDVEALCSAARYEWASAHGAILSARDGPPAGLAALIARGRAALAALAARLNALDVETRDRQEDLDELQPRLDRFFRERLSSPPELPSPWHWRYALRDEPRALVRFDFERRYAEALTR